MSEITIFNLFDTINYVSIQKSSRDRVWMDETSEKFAYRCLPLAIANQHGWDIITNTRVRAIWRGRTNTNSIKLLENNQNVAQSHFGFGVLTFSLPYLIRTSKDINLYVTGPANQPKRGIAALSGIVETDWNPSTFTMNWLFTEPDREIVFEPGEPICHFYPVPRNLIEDTDLVVKSIDQSPDDKKKYYEWSALRDSTLKNKGDWEKHYFQGKYTDGSKCPVNHQTKLKVKDPKIEE